MQNRMTKIICTIGPASSSPEILRELILSGMNVARLNFSHGSYEEHGNRIRLIKKLREELDRPVALLLDTKGPEIRTGSFQGGKTELVSGSSICIRNKDIEGTNREFSVTYKDLHNDVAKGSRILIDDGLIELAVVKIKDKDIYCQVENGGSVSDKKSINVPGAELQLPALTEKDIDDILFAIQEDFDFIAASFVRKARDIQAIRNILEQNDGIYIQLIAKIESGEGVDNFDDILKVADGIMVARGDLGVEIAPEDVPILQKKFIQQCALSGKISITATQMLDSMIRNPRPTRAEVSDVANAIFDGTSAVMLSGETASGKYPIEAFRTMHDIAIKAEGSIDYWGQMLRRDLPLIPTVANAISHATCMTAMDIKATSIITMTLAGRTARLVSRFRPSCPIIASTTSPKSLFQLNLIWGVFPILAEEEKDDLESVLEASIKKSKKSKLLNDGDTVVITGGSPMGVSGTTNMIRVLSIGHSYTQGKGQISSDPSQNRITGKVMIVTNPEESHSFRNHINPSIPLIIVAPYTNNLMMPLLRQASALIVEDEDPTSHASTTAMALDIPVLLSCRGATKVLRDEQLVTLDAEKGIVS